MQNSFTLKDPKVALGKPSKKENYKYELFKLKILTECSSHMSRVICHLSRVTCHVSPVTCPLSPVT